MITLAFAYTGASPLDKNVTGERIRTFVASHFVSCRSAIELRPY